MRAVSMGARMRDERDEEMNDSTSVAMGDVDARISAVMDEAISSSGRPTIAERRLRMNVFKVGSSSEYMNVAFEAFQREVGPLVAQSCEMVSINEEGFLRDKAYRDDVEEGI